MGIRDAFVTAWIALPIIQAAVPTIPGWKITWSDDFTGNINTLPNLNNWIIDTGTSYSGGPPNWGNGEVETYTSSPKNLRLDGKGALQIVALKDTAGRWTSGRIETKRSDFVAAAGKKMRIQATLNLPSITGPAAAGYWPAFWALGSAFRGNYKNWPAPGEWDIMESVNGANVAYGTYHCGTATGGPCNEPNGRGGTRACPNSPCQGNWHTYTLEVDRSSRPEAVRWYISGVLFWQVTADQVPAATWNATTHNGHFILLNMAIGGGFPNALAGGYTPTSATKSGGIFQVGYVAVYNT